MSKAPLTVSGKRFVPLFILLVLCVVGLTIAFRRVTPRPDGAVLQLIAIDDERALAIREGAGGRFPVLMLEKLEGTRPWGRALETTGGGVPPVIDLERDRLYVATRDNRSNRVVRVYALSSGEPLTEGGAPTPAAPVAFGLPPVVLDDEVLALYGPHAAQLTRFKTDGDSATTSARRFETMARALRLDHGFLIIAEAGTATWVSQTERSLGAEGSSYCAAGETVLELKADGHLLDALEGRSVAYLPEGAPLSACARRGDDWIVLRGSDRVDRLHRVTSSGVAVDVALPVAPPAIALPDSLPEVALFVGEDESLIAIDLATGKRRLLEGCGRVAAVLTTPTEHFVFAEGRLVRLDGSASEAVEMPLLRTLLPRRNQLSTKRLWLHQGLRVFPVDRETLQGPATHPVASACARTSSASRAQPGEDSVPN